MFIDLIDQLRCPRPHEESWLVLSADHVDGRDVVDGILGCPVCRAEYAIRGGVARFAEVAAGTGVAPSEEQAMRLAAFLDLTGTKGVAALMGTWGSHAPLVRSLTDIPLLLINPPIGVAMGDGISGITVGRTIALAHGSVRALAIDAGADDQLVESTQGALAAGARVLGPVTVPLPDGVRELVRDQSVWVGERDRDSLTPPRLVVLQRGR